MAGLPNIPAMGRKVDPDVRRGFLALKAFFEAVRKEGGFAAKGGAGLSSTDVTQLVQELLPELLDPTPPLAPTGLLVAGAFDKIFLQWGAPGYGNHSHAEIYRASVDDFGQAVQVGTSQGQVYVDSPPDSRLAATYYYWIRFVSKADVVGPLNATAGTPGNTADEPAYVLEVLADRISESQLLAGLRSRIDLIDTPGTGLVDGLAQEVADRKTAVANETWIRQSADIALSQDISTVQAQVDDPATGLPAAHAAVQTESTARATADGLLSAEHTLKVNANGHVAGMGVAVSGGASGPTTSEIVMLADRFAVVKPTAGAAEPVVIPFVVGEVDGVTKVVMSEALIGDATIGKAAIKLLAVDDGHIADLSAAKLIAGVISAANIFLGASSRVHLDGANERIVVNDGVRNRVVLGKLAAGWGLEVYDAAGRTVIDGSGRLSKDAIDGLGSLAAVNGFTLDNITTYFETAAIGGALLGTASVSTLKIKGGSVVVPVGASNHSPCSTAIRNTWVDFGISGTITITSEDLSEGAIPVIVNAYIDGLVESRYPYGSQDSWGYLRVRRSDGAIVMDPVVFADDISQVPTRQYIATPLSMDSISAPGTYTYTVEFKHQYEFAGTQTTSAAGLIANKHGLSIIGAKR